MAALPYIALIIILILVIIAILYLYTQFLYTKMTIKSYLKKENYLNSKTFSKYNFQEIDNSDFKIEKHEFKLDNKTFKFEVYTKINSSSDNYLMLMFDTNNRKYKAHKYIANDTNYKNYIIFDSLSYQNMQYLVLNEKIYDEIFTKVGQKLKLKKFDLYVNANFTSIIKSSFENKLINNLILENIYFDINEYIEHSIDIQLPSISSWQKNILIKLVTQKIQKQSNINNNWEQIKNKIKKVVNINGNKILNLTNDKLIVEVNNDFKEFVSKQLFNPK